MAVYGGVGVGGRVGCASAAVASSAAATSSRWTVLRAILPLGQHVLSAPCARPCAAPRRATG